MGLLRRCFFKAIYPLPQKGEDTLVYKQNFIDDYTQSSQFQILLEMYLLKYIVSSDEKRNKLQRIVKDKEQKARLEAHKVCRKLLSHTR